MNMDKYFMWIHYERLHNHNKAKHNKTVCKVLGIFCITALFGGQYLLASFKVFFCNDCVFGWRMDRYHQTAIWRNKISKTLGMVSNFMNKLKDRLWYDVGNSYYQTNIYINNVKKWYASDKCGK